MTRDRTRPVDADDLAARRVLRERFVTVFPRARVDLDLAVDR